MRVSQSLPPKDDFEHTRGPRNSAYAVNLTYDRHTYTKYSTLPHGISVYIELKVGMFSEVEGRGKYSLLRVQYADISQGRVLNI